MRASVFFLLVLYAAAVAAAPPDFSAEERQWIAGHPVVAYAFNPRAPPFSFEDQGRHRGLDADVIALLAERTGIRFEPLVGESWPAVLERVRSGEVLMVSQAAISPERQSFLRFSEPVLEMRYGIFTRVKAPFVETAADLDGLRVGIPQGFLIEDRMRSQYPGIRFASFGQVTEGMGRLAVGEYDAVIITVAAGTYAANVRGLSNLRLQAVLPEVYPFAIGVSRSEPLLYAIVQKALTHIDAEEMRSIKARWVGVPGPGYTRSEVAAIAAAIAAIVALFATVNIGFLYARLRSRHRQLVDAERRLEQLATVDELTGLGNRRAYVQTLEAELMRAGRQGTSLTLLELDLDHFKEINDRHGHEAGDRALEAIGELIRSELRYYDRAFRIGGEEFVVLLPTTDIESAKLVAERIRVRIAALAGLARPLTASIGVAVLPAGAAATAEQLYAAADVALYQAKEEGRNRVRMAVLDGAARKPAPELQNG